MKTWEERKKKILYFLYTLSTLGYVSAFVLFQWNSYDYNEIIKIKLSGGFFILGMICAQISGFLTISERDCVIDEKERIWTEEERIEIEKLLLELDD